MATNALHAALELSEPAAAEEAAEASSGFCPLCLRCCGVRWAVSLYTGSLVWYVLEVMLAEDAPFQHMTVILMATAAILGSSRARAGPEHQRRGSLEARPAFESAREYQFCARLMSTISTAIDLLDEGLPMHKSVFTLLLWDVIVAYIIKFVAFHVIVKISGDIILGFQVIIGHPMICAALPGWWHSRVATLLEKVCRGLLLRLSLVFSLLSILLIGYMLVPHEGYVQMLAAGRETGFSLIKDSNELAPFQALINFSWIDRNTRDTLGRKVKNVRLVGVLAFANYSDQLVNYKNAKKSLYRRRWMVGRINTFWNPERPHPWSLDDPSSEGVRTTALLSNSSVRPILDRLFDNREDALDAAINEVILFHGTPTFENVKGIMIHGLRIDLSGSNRGSSFGPGAYFSDMASKCDDYTIPLAFNPFPPKTKFMLLCKVALGNAKTVETTDQSTVGLEWWRRFHSKFGRSFQYNEYIISDGAQAYCPYALAYEDTWTFYRCAETSFDIFWLTVALVSGVTYRVNRIFPPEGEICWSC